MEFCGYNYTIVNGYRIHYKEVLTYTKMHRNSITIQYLRSILHFGLARRKDVQKDVYGQVKYSSYGGLIWRNLLASEMINKVRIKNTTYYTITQKGKDLIKYVNEK
jgi:hypothetical protein